MRTRRQRQRQRYTDENVDRWMISYADFITLLFAFFVVMYAISSVNEGKYRVLAETFRNKFGMGPSERMNDSSAATQLEIEDSVVPGLSLIPLSETSSSADRPNDASAGPEASLQHVADELRGMLGGLINRGKIALRHTDRGLELEINSRLLFASASSALNEHYRPLLERVAGVLRGEPNAIDVEGFTDDVPIHTDRFPSNWELSAARAAAVIRLLVENGVEPGRLAAVGYGPYRPVASNGDPGGRAKNRRVVLVIRESVRNLPTAAGETT